MLTSALTASPDFNRRLAVAASGVDVAYPAGAGDHPLTGPRVPNLKLADGSDTFGWPATGRFVLIGVSPGDLSEQAGHETSHATGPDAGPTRAAGAAAALRRWLPDRQTASR